MTGDLDIPNLFFPKPKVIAELEELSKEQREAMDFVEIEERLDSAADSIAKGYHDHAPKGDMDGCVLVVHAALSELGGSFGGKMGARIVAKSEHAANRACQEFYPKAD